MLTEYNIWKRIFDECSEEELVDYLSLVTNSDEVIDYLYDKILEYRNNPKYKITLNISLDSSLKDIPIEELSKDIVKQLSHCLKDNIIFE